MIRATRRSRELAHDGLWFRGATAVHDSTALAVPAMLDGRYPRPGFRSDVYSHPANLFTLLADDYELHVSEEATGLCPTSLCVPTPGTTASHLSRGKPGRFRQFVRGVRATRQPALWFKHVLLPHVPWQYYPSGRSYRRFAPEPIPGLNGLLGFGVPWLVKVSYQRHLLQLGMADRLLGELVRRLRSAGLYRDALVVVAADHGIGFRVGLGAPDHPAAKRAGPGARASDREAAGRARRACDRPPRRDDRRAADDPGAGGRAGAGAGGRALALPPCRGAVAPRDGLPPSRDRAEHGRRRLHLRRWRRGAPPRRGRAAQDGMVRKRRGPEPRRALPDRPARRAGGAAACGACPLEREEAAESARIDQAEDLREVDPGSRFVPGQITGELPDGRPGGGRQVALALNGKIAATGWTFSLEGSPRESFELMVPESAFGHGPNHARLFEIVAGEWRSGAAAADPGFPRVRSSR